MRSGDRRAFLRLGGVACGTALAGCLGWFGDDGSVVDDFEDGTVEGWSGDTDALSVSGAAIRGNHSARLRFTDHPTVWTDFDSTTAPEYEFWWKSGAVGDNELNYAFHDFTGDGRAPYADTGFGIEVGAENRAVVAVTPPFANTGSYVPLYEQPASDTWYGVRFSNVDFAESTLDVALYDESGQKLGEVTGHSFADGIDSVSRFQFDNSMNFSGAPAHVDRITAGAPE